MEKILSLAALLVVVGCTPLSMQSASEPQQCVGVMSPQDAYGYLDPSHFTVQVLALSQEKDIQNYIRDIDPRHPVWVNWKASRGTQWYAVTMGDFADAAQAKAAIATLPPIVKRSEPFVLSFAEMQSKQQTNVVRMR